MNKKYKKIKVLFFCSMCLFSVLFSSCSKKLSEPESKYVAFNIIEMIPNLITDSDEYWTCRNFGGFFSEKDNGDGTYTMTYINCLIEDDEYNVFESCETNKSFIANGTVLYTETDLVVSYVGSVEFTGDIEGKCDVNISKQHDQESIEGTICGLEVDYIYENISTVCDDLAAN